MGIDKKIKSLKRDLYKCMARYGLTDERTVQASQKLDRAVVEKQIMMFTLS